MLWMQRRLCGRYKRVQTNAQRLGENETNYARHYSDCLIAVIELVTRCQQTNTTLPAVCWGACSG